MSDNPGRKATLNDRCRHGVQFRHLCVLCEQKRTAVAATKADVHEPLSMFELSYYAGHKFCYGF
jgi:hypothetical protein